MTVIFWRVAQREKKDGGCVDREIYNAGQVRKQLLCVWVKKTDKDERMREAKSSGNEKVSGKGR